MSTRSDLARRLVACPEWRWQEGMRLRRPRPLSGEPDYGRAVTSAGRLSVAWDSGSYWEPSREGWATYLPDLSDAATAGVLLSWLPSVWGFASGDGRFVVKAGPDHADHFGPTLGEAAASALISLWEVRRG